MINYFKWGAPQALLWLWVIPLLGVLAWRALALRLAAIRQFCPVQPERRLGMFPLRERIILKSGLGLLALALVIVALARPQVGLQRERAKRQGADVMLVLDTSQSMLAKDMVPSRLDAAKNAAFTLLSRLPNDRFGIVVFAGDAQLYCPLTVDHDAVQMFLDSIQAGTSPKPGTALSEALTVAGQALGESEGKHRALVLLSDGEDHGTDALGAAERAVRQTAAKIEVLGFGSPAGEPIPVYDGQGNATGFKRDEKGEVVLSKLGESELRKIADIGKGMYKRATDGGAADELAQRLEAIEGAQVGTMVYTAYGERFQWVLALAIGLLALEAVLSERRGRRKLVKQT